MGLLLDREILGLSDSLSARCAVRASLPKYAMSSGGPSANAAASSVAREEISYAAFLAREFGCTSPSLGMTEDGAPTRPYSKVVVAAAKRRRLARSLSREAPQWWTPPGAPEPELSDSDECPTPRVKRSTPSGPSPSSLCERDDNGRVAGNSIGDIATSELFGTECDRSDSDREAVRGDGCESEVGCTGIGFVSRVDGRIGDAASEAAPSEQRQIALWCDGRLNQGQAVVPSVDLPFVPSELAIVPAGLLVVAAPPRQPPRQPRHRPAPSHSIDARVRALMIKNHAPLNSTVRHRVASGNTDVETFVEDGFDIVAEHVARKTIKRRRDGIELGMYTTTTRIVKIPRT